MGNPGEEYRYTRHNVGFLFLDLVSKDMGFSFKDVFFALLGEKNHKGKEIIFIKPKTYMNNSGIAVSKIVPKDEVEKLIVVHDDMDVELGRIKLRRNGGDGGHKGIRSIAEHMGSKDFYRIKIGIGRPKDIPITNYVLSPFKEEELPLVSLSLEKALKLFYLVLDHGPDKSWSIFRKWEVEGERSNYKTHETG